LEKQCHGHRLSAVGRTELLAKSGFGLVLPFEYGADVMQIVDDKPDPLVAAAAIQELRLEPNSASMYRESVVAYVLLARLEAESWRTPQSSLR
jgi:hypothetical protein